MSALAEVREVEVSAKAQRRRFTAEYKRKVLQEADACTKSGEIAALLRREALYSSHLTAWRRQREARWLLCPYGVPSMSDRDERLSQFFGGYFNQDWDIGGARSWTDVIVRYVKENSRTQVLTVRDDLLSWLEETASYPGRGLPAAFRCDYDPRPDGIDERQWVRQLADFMQKQLTN